MKKHLVKYYTLLIILTFLSIILTSIFINDLLKNYYWLISVFYFIFLGSFHGIVIFFKDKKKFNSLLLLALSIKFLIFVMAIFFMYLFLEKNFKQYAIIFLIHYVFYITFEIYFLKEILVFKNKYTNNLQK